MNENKEEMLMAVKTVIQGFANKQFAANGISYVEAMLIAKAIYSDIADRCFTESIGKRIKFDDPRQTETKIGTVDELMEDFKDSGFKPSVKE